MAMTHTQKYALISIILGVIVTPIFSHYIGKPIYTSFAPVDGTYYFLTFLFCLMAIGVIYGTLLKSKADETIIEQGYKRRPKK